MNEGTFKVILYLIAIGFSLFSLIFFIAPIVANPDIVGVLKAGFVNSYASAYSIDLITCWVVLIFWILFERVDLSIKYGWVCIPIGLTLGVAVALALYLLLRISQLSKQGIGNA